PKEYLSIQLVPRPDKFYLIEIVNDPRGLRENVTTLTEKADGVERSNVTTYSQNKLKFTLQFGKTIGIWTGRFGIKESTGGVGLEVTFRGASFERSAQRGRRPTGPRRAGSGLGAVLAASLFVACSAENGHGVLKGTVNVPECVFNGGVAEPYLADQMQVLD